MSKKSDQTKQKKVEELLKFYPTSKEGEKALKALKEEVIQLLTMGEVVESPLGTVSLTEVTLEKVDYERLNDLLKEEEITLEERAAYFQESYRLTPKGKEALKKNKAVQACTTLSKSPRLNIKPTA
ncbi:MAG: hypothetical protein IEMM0008_1729 [bacterium]|nr:MAG: hypothetical protein IEMM0008_1729 [bacterium]